MKHMTLSAQKLKNALCDAAAVCVKLEAMFIITAIYLEQEMQTRLWWGLAGCLLGRSLVSGGRLYVGDFGRKQASVAVKMVSHSFYFRNFINFELFSTICKDNVEISCLSVSHKNFHSRKLRRAILGYCN
jgi:hypothetical protein